MANVSIAAGVRSLVEGTNINCFQISAVVKEEEQSPPTESDVKLGEISHQSPEVESASEKAEFQFLKAPSLDELGSLSTSIHAFQNRLNELQDHLHFIHNAIATSSKSLQINHRQSQSVRDAKITSTFDSSTTVATAENGEQPVSSSSNPRAAGNGGRTDGKDSRVKQSQASSLSELEHICETMCSRGLRKYIVSHLSNIDSLRHQIPLALKFAPKPAKLVFECIGRFYLQGSKAYCKDSPMIPARQASVLILELFLLSCAGETENVKKIEIEPSLKAEADLAAIAWRKRVIVESGLRQASDVDARGLLLFLASFGIPTVFSNDDLRNLLRSSNPKGIPDVLRRSPILLTRIPDIIKGMTKNGMNIDAVDIVFAFGLEDEFPPQEILSSFLQECDERWKKSINESRGSTMKQRQENERKLASLKSVLKCLDDHKIDPVKHLPEWQIQEVIINLEKDIAELDKKMKEKALMKRKTDEISSQNHQNQEIKRSRTVPTGFPAPYPANSLLEQNITSYLDNKISYSSSMPNTLLEGGNPAQLPGSSLESLSANMESFAGMPRRATSNLLNQNKTFDLYHFADAVFDGELPKTTTQSAGLPRLLPSHPSPYFYK